jgi:hypothetical protein
VYVVRRFAAGMVVVALLAGAYVLVGGGGGSHSMDDRHLSLRYEGDAAGLTGTVTRLVVDGDDLLLDRRSSLARTVSVVQDGQGFACRLDAEPAYCVRSTARTEVASLTASASFYLDPLAAGGTFGSGGAAAQPAEDRTVAGRASTCVTVRVPDKEDAFTVCRDAKLGFLTYAKGPALDLSLTSATGPSKGEVAVPDVKVEDGSRDG